MSTEALLQARDALSAALAAVDIALGQDAPPIDRPDLLEVDEAAELAGVTEATIRKWAADHRRGRVPDWFAYQLGGRWHLSRSQFSAFLRGGVR